jgi:hypothetical protein
MMTETGEETNPPRTSIKKFLSSRRRAFFQRPSALKCMYTDAVARRLWKVAQIKIGNVIQAQKCAGRSHALAWLGSPAPRCNAHRLLQMRAIDGKHGDHRHRQSIQSLEDDFSRLEVKRTCCGSIHSARMPKLFSKAAKMASIWSVLNAPPTGRFSSAGSASSILMSE